MRTLTKILFSFSVILLPISAFSSAQSTLKQQMTSDLDVIRNSFEVDYAPKEWKQSYTSWDLDTEINKAKQKINDAENISVKEYQRIVRDFFSSTKDYHVGVYFYSTEYAFLPFLVKGAEGKYFITYVDHEKLNSAIYPIHEGDEVVSFDGKPVGEVVTELMKDEFGDSNTGTDKALAERKLTYRAGVFGDVVPKGRIMIGIKPAGASKIVSMQLIWNYFPEKIINRMHGNGTEPVNELAAKETFFKKKMCAPFYEAGSHKVLGKSGEAFDIGGRKSYVPTLGRVWWESKEKSPFHAYLFETEDRKLIGYLRIPHYVGGTYHAEEFEKIIRLFEERSDALIIDQINNPGGYVFYLYALASMLTEEPLYAPQHRMTITTRDVAEAVQLQEIAQTIHSDSEAQTWLGETIEGMPVTHQTVQFILNYSNFILEQWQAGKPLTDPHYIFGFDQINPHPTTRYTKPILMLINSLDFSGADFFPAILQDNKRVTLLGTKTAGAGGYVGGAAFPNRFGIMGYSYTLSLAQRIDSKPIENLGVQPDIEYELTQEDLQYNYQGYAQAILDAVHGLIPSKTLE